MATRQTSQRKRDRFRSWLYGSPREPPEEAPSSTPSRALTVTTLGVPPPSSSASTAVEISSSALSARSSEKLEPIQLPRVSQDDPNQSQQALPAARSISEEVLEEALELLEEPEKSAIEEFLSPGKKDFSLVFASVLKAANEKRQVCESKRWRITMAGREIILRDEIDKVFRWLDRFKNIASIAVNADPVHAGLPWAAVLFLLEVTLAERRQMAALLQGIKSALYVMTRVTLYFEYLNNVPDTAEKKNLKSLLAQISALLLQFLARAVVIFQGSTLGRMLDASWTLDVTLTFENECDKLCTRIDRDAVSCDRALHAQDRTSLKGLQEECAKIQQLKGNLIKVSKKLNEIWKVMEHEQQVKILQWTSQTPYLDNHTAIFQDRTRGTGDWIYQHEQYRIWQESDKSMILWLHGIPGAGKSKLISNVVDHFMKQPSEEGLAYFYCNRYDEARRRPEDVLRSLLRQLAISRNNAEIQELLVEAYKNKSEQGFASTQLSFKEIRFLLPQLMKAYRQTTLIIDALDECHEKSRLKLIRIFGELIEGPSTVKIIIASRCDGDIKAQLSKEANLGIGVEENRNDIITFAIDRLLEDAKWRRKPLSSGLRDEIVQAIYYNSHGMFQWAAMQLSHLLQLERESDIRQRLGKLPRDLTAAYDEIYSLIKTQDGSKPTVALQVIQWLLSSAERPSKELILAVVCQDITQMELQEIDIDSEFVLGACRNLVVEVDGRYTFSHLSVAEYFESQHPELSIEADLFTAEICFWYLYRFEPTGQELRPEWLVMDNGRMEADNHELVRLSWYVLKYWPEHARKIAKLGADHQIFGMIRHFFGLKTQGSAAYRYWHATQWSEFVPGFKHRLGIVEMSYSRIKDLLEPSTHPLLSASLFGLGRVLDMTYSKDEIDPNQRNSRGIPLLTLAVIGGHTDTILFLLERGADINGRDKDYGSALTAAVVQGNVQVVQLLVRKGADPNNVGGLYGTALTAAAEKGDQEMIDLLISKGAGITIGGGLYGTPLVAAVVHERVHIILMLFSRRSDAEIGGSTYGNAFQAARNSTNRGLKDFFHEHETGHSNQRDAILSTPASTLGGGAASGNQYPLSIRDALENAEVITRRNSLSVDDLVAAIEQGNSFLVRILIADGIDVNSTISYGPLRSILSIASASKNHIAAREILLPLLISGADVNAPVKGSLGSALAAAAYHGCEESVRFLLQYGANINAKLHGLFGSALAAAAAMHNNERVVLLLLDNGARINSRLPGPYPSALAAARETGNDPIVDLLVSRGAVDQPRRRKTAANRQT